MSPRKLRVGIVGVGNCASSFVQGLTYYREAKANEPVPGLMNVELGGYHVGDIEIASAFDVNAAKVGRDVAEAIFARAEQHPALRRAAPTGVTVRRGRPSTASASYLRDEIAGIRRARGECRRRSSRRSRTDVLVSYLPVGSQQATEFYAEQALEAGCAFVNCIPVFIASDPDWRQRFEERGLPIIGDDIKSQVGATIVHRDARQPVPRARRAARPHLPAQLRRQHRLPEHARAGAAGVEEDLQDAGRHQPARHAARRATTSMSARATTCRG